MARPCTETPFEEVWAHLPDDQSLCAWINADVGWLMYLRYSGDSGFSSRNPVYHGDPGEQIEYQLANGQRDSYPPGWALSVGVIREAME